MAIPRRRFLGLGAGAAAAAVTGCGSRLGWQEQCPGNDHVVLQPDDAFGSGRGREAGYAFDTLGPRVPAVVVSPWIDRGSVFGWKAHDPARRATFDHTSILATVGAMTGVWVDSKRARAATNLGVTVNRDSPRDDYPRRMKYDAGVYRTARIAESDGIDGEVDAGVAGELLDAWHAEHGDATPAEMVERYRELLGG